MKRRSLIKAFTLTASIAAMGMTWTVQAAETIKVGILHSLSGTMAISETSQGHGTDDHRRDQRQGRRERQDA